MKYMVLIVAFVATFPCVAADDDNHCVTNARLPEDQQIWPMPDLEPNKEILDVKAEFVEAKEVLSVSQGNFRQVTYAVRYKLIEKHEAFPKGELRFIVQDSFPTEASGIRVKRVPFAFRAGKMTFHLQKDDRVKHMDFFGIVAYAGSS